MSKDIKDYLHLYLGCQCIVDMSRYLSGAGKNFKMAEVPATFDSINRNRGELTNGKLNQFVGVTLNDSERGFLYYDVFDKECNCYTHFVHPENIKPLLRPLSDMTEEEAWECHKLTNDNISGNGSEVIGYYSQIQMYDPEEMRYLLSKGFDLFDLIPDKLAIDKTKI